MKYKFNPIEHGYEPISNFPELEYMFPLLDDKYFIKVVAYSDYSDLVYWYSVINLLGHDDRIEITSLSYDWRNSNDYENQKQNSIKNYLGMITSDEYAKELLQHIFTPLTNEHYEKDGVKRYNENLGKQMRLEFTSHYKI